MKAVARMCEENTAHHSSFPVTDMSLLDLEYASMGVTRWSKLISDTAKAGKGLLSASRVRRLGNDITSAQPYLIPGGRFLIMLNEGCLSMWDLLDIHEASGPADVDERPIASVDSLDCGSFIAHPTPDGSGIIIITVTYTSEDTDIR